LEVVHERCCGLDVHKKSVVACMLLPGREREVRTFGTVTREILRLLEWLEQEKVTHVAMESTGVYWKPIFNLLEGQGMELVVVNAKHMKAVPGRKTDVKDAEWIADLLRHGLLKPSFIPGREQREQRELLRHRRMLVEQRADVVKAIQSMLEGANIKLGDVATDVMGASGRAMLRSLAEDENASPTNLAGLARGRLRDKQADLELALEGSMGPHQRYMLAQQLRHVEFIEQQIEEISKEIEERMRPFLAAMELLDSIPGIGPRIAQTIVAEAGVDMSRFPTAGHLASWTGLAPGQNQSAGKNRSGRTRQGNRFLKSAMVEAAHGAVRTKDSYFGALYRRIAARAGKQRAIVAVAHSLLVTAYYMLKNGTLYQDLGPNHFDHTDRERIIHNSLRKLERLGLKVTVEELDAA
jgi:transposase